MARYSENTAAEIAMPAKAESARVINLLDRFDKELELSERSYERLYGAIQVVLTAGVDETSVPRDDSPPSSDSQLYSALEARLNTLQHQRFLLENLIDRIQL